MELSSEDQLRLNVLLANQPQAIRIDEGKLILYGLGPRGEATVRLAPNSRPDTYVRMVREWLSGRVLGSPGSYPVYLSRWTRMGQMRAERLEQLLLLGEPEAVVAVVCAPGLTDALARSAWWAMEDAENARRMLGNPIIATGTMGEILAAYLLDYLPFETEAVPIMESVRLILQPGLLDADARAELWRKAARKQTYLVGFLRAGLDALPETEPERTLDPAVADSLRAVAATGDPWAGLMLRVCSGPGQTWLKTLAAVLAKPPNQDVVTAAFACLRGYFGALREEPDPDALFAELVADAERFVAAAQCRSPIAACLRQSPTLAAEVAAMHVLSGVGLGVMRPVLPDPTTQGTLMQRRLAPVIDPLMERIILLRGGRQ
ncbi:sulfur reduction protein DsrS [uncultured Lamprocystis sp.]|uniref:sulfur reduction protein DsrS n=1 Tax=uncultured Lamprocystis sp. TaxID=543132 RepID=UPI0025FD82EF|nr:sulfur reduction protein DsrS [uncultured Lamprocystis sp.]